MKREDTPEYDIKRVRERLDYAVNVLFEIDGKTTYFTETTDISMSGMFLLTNSPPAVGTTGSITMVLECGEDKITIKAECEVVRVASPGSRKDGDHKYGAGIQFTYIDSESSINLYNIMKYNIGEEKMIL